MNKKLTAGLLIASLLSTQMPILADEIGGISGNINTVTENTQSTESEEVNKETRQSSAVEETTEIEENKAETIEASIENKTETIEALIENKNETIDVDTTKEKITDAIEASSIEEKEDIITSSEEKADIITFSEENADIITSSEENADREADITEKRIRYTIGDIKMINRSGSLSDIIFFEDSIGSAAGAVMYIEIELKDADYYFDFEDINNDTLDSEGFRIFNKEQISAETSNFDKYVKLTQGFSNQKDNINVSYKIDPHNKNDKGQCIFKLDFTNVVNSNLIGKLTLQELAVNSDEKNLMPGELLERI